MSAPLRLVRPGAARSASQFDVAPNPVWLQQLIEMGFEKRQCEKALIETRNSSLQSAMDWIFEHPSTHSDPATAVQPFDDPEILPDSQEMEQPSAAIVPPTQATTTTTTTTSPPTGANLITEQHSDPPILDEHGRIRMIFEDGISLSGGTKLRGFTPEEKMSFQEKQRRKHEEEVRRERQAKAQELKLLRERMELEKKERLSRSRQAFSAAAATTTQVAQPIADNLDTEQHADLLQISGKAPLYSSPAPTGSASPVISASTDAGASSSSSSIEMQTCVLQIRFPDGSTQKQEFRAGELLQTVHDFVLSKMIASNPTDSAAQFTLIIPFPRKEFGAETMTSTLRDCGLCPRAQLIVQKTEDRGIVRKATHSNRRQFGGSSENADARFNLFPPPIRPNYAGDDDDDDDDDDDADGHSNEEEGDGRPDAGISFGFGGFRGWDHRSSYEHNLLLAERIGSVEMGLDFEQLAQLPISIFTTAGAAETTFETAHRCAICMADYEAQQEIITLPCGHQFHKTCFYSWCKSHRNCPYCKCDIVSQQRNRS